MACPGCGTVLFKAIDFHDHVHRCGVPTLLKIKCPVKLCEHRMEWGADLQSSFEKHQLEQCMQTCNVCKLNVEGSKALEQHESIECPRPCWRCKLEFKGVAQLSNHVRNECSTPCMKCGESHQGQLKAMQCAADVAQEYVDAKRNNKASGLAFVHLANRLRKHKDDPNLPEPWKSSYDGTIAFLNTLFPPTL
jgi:hypothetical protein